MSGLMLGFVVTIHIVACLALMISILLQSGKGGGLAGAFGGGSSQTLFGGRGAAGFLSRATTVLAIVFFVTSLTLGLSSAKQGARRSLVQDDARRRSARGAQPAAAPTAPGGAQQTAPQTAPGGAPQTAPQSAPQTAPGPAPPGTTTNPAPGGGQSPATGGTP